MSNWSSTAARLTWRDRRGKAQDCAARLEWVDKVDPSQPEYWAMKKVTGLLLALVVVVASSPVLGHHSFAMFDVAKRVTITGVVKEIQWANPHVWVYVDVPRSDGPPVRWGIEYTSVNHLTRVVGMTRNTIKPGDTVEFQINPYADGTPGGRFQIMKLPNGRFYCDVGAVQQFCAQNNK